MITKNYLTFEEWIFSLRKYVPISIEKEIEARQVYENLIKALERYVPNNIQEDNIDITINMQPFYREGNSNQVIAHPNEVLDMNEKLDLSKMNWHGQNTSRWLFACGILYDIRDMRFSMHT